MSTIGHTFMSKHIPEATTCSQQIGKLLPNKPKQVLSSNAEQTLVGGGGGIHASLFMTYNKLYGNNAPPPHPHNHCRLTSSETWNEHQHTYQHVYNHMSHMLGNFMGILPILQQHAQQKHEMKKQKQTPAHNIHITCGSTAHTTHMGKVSWWLNMQKQTDIFTIQKSHPQSHSEIVIKLIEAKHCSHHTLTSGNRCATKHTQRLSSWRNINETTCSCLYAEQDRLCWMTEGTHMIKHIQWLIIIYIYLYEHSQTEVHIHAEKHEQLVCWNSFLQKLTQSQHGIVHMLLLDLLSIFTKTSMNMHIMMCIFIKVHMLLLELYSMFTKIAWICTSWCADLC